MDLYISLKMEPMNIKRYTSVCLRVITKRLQGDVFSLFSFFRPSKSKIRSSFASLTCFSSVEEGFTLSFYVLVSLLLSLSPFCGLWWCVIAVLFRFSAGGKLMFNLRAVAKRDAEAQCCFRLWLEDTSFRWFETVVLGRLSEHISAGSLVFGSELWLRGDGLFHSFR